MLATFAEQYLVKDLTIDICHDLNVEVQLCLMNNFVYPFVQT